MLAGFRNHRNFYHPWVCAFLMVGHPWRGGAEGLPAGVHPAAHRGGGDLYAARPRPPVVGSHHPRRAPLRRAVRPRQVPPVLPRPHRRRRLRLRLRQRRRRRAAAPPADVVVVGEGSAGGGGWQRRGGGEAGAVAAAGHAGEEGVVPGELRLHPGDPGEEPRPPTLRPRRRRRRLPRAVRAHAPRRARARRRELPLLPWKLLHVHPRRRRGRRRRLRPRVRGVQGREGDRGAGVVAGPPHQGLPAQPVLPPQVQARAQGALRLPRRRLRRRRRLGGGGGEVLAALGVGGAPERVARAAGRHGARRRGPAAAVAAPAGLRDVRAGRRARAAAVGGDGDGYVPARQEEVVRRHLLKGR